MDPRWLIISPEDETGGRQRRFFGWLVWILAVILILGLLLFAGMLWQAAVFAGIVVLIFVVGWWLGRWVLRSTDGGDG